MFALPSMWNIIISTIVFFIAAWYIHRYMETQGISKGLTRSLLVFLLASMVSWGAGAVVDWFQGPDETQTTQGADDLLQLLKAAEKP